MIVLRIFRVGVLCCCCVAAEAKHPVATGRGGAVATLSEQASEAAIEILNQGGNAIDAAVAASATLGVTDPFSCGIGGGGFMLIHLAESGRVVALDFRERAPASATPGLFEADGEPMNFASAVASGLSVGVPGTVRGWQEVLSRHGTMDLGAVLAPAIRVAEEGFPVEGDFQDAEPEDIKKLGLFASTAELFLRDGRPIPMGTRFRNPDLAKTYRALAEGGVDAFYGGPMAGAIVSAVNAPPVRGNARVPGGSMTLDDLRDYKARFLEPVRSTYRGYEIFGMPLPSSGGIAIAQALNILETFDLSGMGRSQVEHFYLEASRLAFADRNAFVGDGEFVAVPVAGLLSRDYAGIRAALIDPGQTQGTVSPGDPFPFQTGASSLLQQAAIARAEPADTAHLTVSDASGNIVACTFTIESWGGSGIVVPGWGFLLNNELTDFDFSGPHPNMPEARKRPRSSMSPTIAFRDGSPAFTVGSPGGATIITTVLQVIVNHIDLGMSLEEALAAPRLSQRNTAATRIETASGFPGSDQARALEAMGHVWEETGEIGAANGLQFHADGTVTAVSERDRRGGGSALVQRPR